MAGLSILVEPLYPISALSQPIQLLLLIAFFHFPPSLSFSLHPSLCACFGEAISLQQCLSEVPPVLDPHLPLPVCVFAYPCVRMNKQWRATLCVHRQKDRVSFLTFAQQSAESWLVQSIDSYRRWRSGPSQHSHQQSFKASRR